MLLNDKKNFQEATQMYPNVFDEVNKTWLETEDMKLPFERFNATTYPKVWFCLLFALHVKVLSIFAILGIQSIT